MYAAIIYISFVSEITAFKKYMQFFLPQYHTVYQCIKCNKFSAMVKLTEFNLTLVFS